MKYFPSASSRERKEEAGRRGPILAGRIQKLQKAHGFIVLRLTSIRVRQNDEVYKKDYKNKATRDWFAGPSMVGEEVP
jgi:hypothetical protein